MLFDAASKKCVSATFQMAYSTNGSDGIALCQIYTLHHEIYIHNIGIYTLLLYLFATISLSNASKAWASQRFIILIMIINNVHIITITMICS